MTKLRSREKAYMFIEQYESGKDASICLFYQDG